MNRRTFLQSSTAMAVAASVSAATRARAAGANDRIRLGLIGCGQRGRNAHLAGIRPHAAAANVDVVAVCDPWRVHREEAAAQAKEWFGASPREFVNHRELLALDGLDAVMIATPDHLHTLHLEAAAQAGKHIYVEKPLATDMAKLVRAYDSAKAAQARGRAIQVGTQLRSLPGIVGAREIVQSGVLGKITRIDETRNAEKPYWYHYLGREVRAADTNWAEFLGDLPPQPFDGRRHGAWYGYYEFCQGPVPQWGAHFLDLMHYVTGCGMPESCVCLGGVTYWKDENQFTTPDNVMATWLYPEGFIVTSSNNFGNGAGNARKFYGDRGTLDVGNWNVPTYSAVGGPKRDGRIRGTITVPPVERPDHFLDWLQCIRSGATPHASIDAGFQHAVAVLMATRSYETGRKTTYDSAARAIRTA